MTRTALRYAGHAAAGLALLAVLGGLAVLTVIPRAVDGAALTVLTGSMTPTIPAGAVVVVRPVDPGTLRVGDVITFQRKPGRAASYITHRIVQIHDDAGSVSFTTKGDANGNADSAPVPAPAVRGKVLLHVPFLGTFRNAIGSGPVAVGAVLVGLIGYALTQLVAGVREHLHGLPALEPDTSAETEALGLQLLVVTLPIAEFEGLLPYQVAELLRVDLLEEGLDQFTIAVAREPAQLDELTHVLLMFKPVTLVRSELVKVPFCRPAVPDETPTPRSAATESVHA